MASELPWKLAQDIRDHAMRQGEEIAAAYSFTAPPIDPLRVVGKEEVIHAEGDDLAGAFDGCLEYLGGGRYLLAYNTKYDIWPHAGTHHPKVRFTIAHELGHYFREEHRNILRNGGPAYRCLTEFTVDPLMEQEADCFAAGLLMPSGILASIVNQEPDPNLAMIKDAARTFDVSLTSMMIRWVRLSDFPCGIFSVTPAGMHWGWVSDALASRGMFNKHRGPAQSKDAQAFLGRGTDLYREGHGLGMLSQWLETDSRISVQEYYAVIPHARHMLCFLTAAEDELDPVSGGWDGDDD
jgi:hypothetical protein